VFELDKRDLPKNYQTAIMKVTAVVLAATATAQDKKVPPRTPEQRLNRLVQFSHEWLDDNVPDLASLQSWKNKFQNNADRMSAAFNRDICGYFDPDNKPHGGPDPNPELRPNLKPRMRRDTTGDETDGGLYDEEGFMRYDKSNPIRGIKQITTGYRKWSERYINECHGQRKYKYQKQRMQKWFTTLGNHYTNTQ
jgi:hypothetical protein